MVDRYGRPTFDDGMNIMRGFMDIQAYGQKQKAYQEDELANKYFGQKIKGEDIPQGDGYSPTADLKADEMVNRKWISGQTRQINEAEEKLAKLPDEEVLKYDPANYAEHVVVSKRIEQYGSDKQNRQAIDEMNNKKAMESYQFSMAAFNEARDKYAKGDLKGASDNLVKIGQITNNPFKVKPSEDGKTVELYFTKDGVDQPGQKYPIDQAMEIAQQFLNGEEFFKAHLQNREARKQLNLESNLNPIILEKDGKSLRAIRQLNLNTNQVSWAVYDEKGKPYSDKPINDIGELIKEGWTRYDPKAEGEMLKRRKLVAEIDKLESQAQGTWPGRGGSDSKGGKPGRWVKDWWPQTPDEQEGGDPNLTTARSIVAKAYDHSSRETQHLIANQILPEFQTWVEQNKDQMVKGEDGKERPLNSQDLQNAFDYIAYEVAQRAKGGETAEGTAKAGTKTEEGEGRTGAAAGPSEGTPEAEEAAETEKTAATEKPPEPELFLGNDENLYKIVDGQPVRVMRKPSERIYNKRYPNPEWAKYQKLLKQIKAREDAREHNPREPMKFNR